MLTPRILKCNCQIITGGSGGYAPNNDPEDSITAACSLLESLFCTIILASGEELPEKKDVGGSWKNADEPEIAQALRAGLAAFVAACGRTGHS
jgi:hypothetical protein